MSRWRRFIGPRWQWQTVLLAAAHAVAVLTFGALDNRWGILAAAPLLAAAFCTVADGWPQKARRQ